LDLLPRVVVEGSSAVVVLAEVDRYQGVAVWQSPPLLDRQELLA